MIEELDFLEFFDSATTYGIIKATVHKTGKLGFSSGANKYMNLNDTVYFNIGTNKNDESDKSLYLVPVVSKCDKSFRVVRAGEYFYVFIKNILKELDMDYKNESIIYDIEKIGDGEKKYFKLERRD